MRQRSSWLVFLVLGVGIAVRLLYLDADPYYYEWIGYITDEGRWVQQARSLALQRNLWGGHAHELHLVLAPLFQLVHYVIFSLIGVSVWSSRVLTAVSGSAVPLLFWWRLRGVAAPQALLLGVTLLATQPDLVELSRVAVPETVVMLLQLAIYFLIVQRGGASRRMYAGGLLLLVTVGMKATVAPMVAIFTLMILGEPLLTEGVRIRRWSDLTRFWCGFTAPLAALALVGILHAPTNAAHPFPPISLFAHFLHVDELWGICAFLFQDTLSPVINLWGLGVWLSVLGWTADKEGDAVRPLRPYLVTSMIWLGVYFVLMLLSEYFPTRYKVHILLPMAVQITAGLSVLQRGGIDRVCVSFTAAEGMWQRLRLWLLSLPTAALLAPILATLGRFAGIDPSRLRTKIAWLIIALILTATVAHLLKRHPRAVKFLLVFPLLAGLAWFLLTSVLNYSPFWPSADSAVAEAWWAWLLITAALTVFLVQRAAVWEAKGCARVVTLYAAFCLIGALAGLSPGYRDPHYSIRDASRDIGKVLADSKSVAVFRAEGLFNGNAVAYRSFDKETEFEKPDAVVVGFALKDKDPIEWLEQNYTVARTYRLYASPEYARLQPNGDNVAGVATLYKRRDVPKENERSLPQ
jgi:hypothetical protein